MHLLKFINNRNLINGFKYGDAIERYPDGSRIKITYCHNLKHGKQVAYYSTGEIMFYKHHVYDKCHGLWTGFFKDGTILNMFEYKNNLVGKVYKY